ncbi:MAG: PAS domain S-box protein [Anaeromyxobacteraceae bacterium]
MRTAKSADSSHLLDLLFDDPAVGRCLVAPDGSVLRANRAWLRSTGLAPDDVLGVDIIELFPETRDMALAIHARARAGHHVRVPRHAQRIDGRETWWEGSVDPVPMEDGTGLLITAHEALSASVDETTARLAAIVESSDDAIVSKDLAGTILTWNPAAERLFGYHADEVVGRSIEIIIPLERRDEEREILRRVGAGHRVERLETARVTKQGELLEVSITVSPVPDREGRIIAASKIARDITGLKRSERALRETETRYRTLFDAIDEGFCIIEVLFDDAGNPTDYRFVEVNQAFEQQTGLVNATGKRMRELAPSHEEHWFEIYGRIAVTGEPARFQNQAQALGRWFEVFAFRVGAPERRMVGVLFNDITARIRAEEGLRESEQRYRTLFTNMTEGFALGEVINDDAGTPSDVRLIEMNEAFEEQTGLKREKARGRPIREVLPQVEQSWIDTYCEVALGGPARRFENYNRDLDRHFSLYCFSPARGRFAVLFSDVTERKRAEDALREADRQKTEFLGVLSHELRNPLAPIRNSIFLLERAPPGSEQATHAREVVRRQAEHLTRLVDDLLDITRISRGKIGLQRTRVDLREIVQKTTDDLHSLFAQASVELRVDYATFGPVWIEADPTRMAQVLGNLLQNAVKFTPSGGSVIVSVGSGSDGAQLCVRDNGAGMEPGTIEHMFQPFAQATQTLARTKGGLGLGLALVKGLVEMHGGSVHARSDGLGRGSEFLVHIPISSAAAQPEHERVVTADAVGKLILIIEDNMDAGESLAEILGMYGHRVHLARDGRTGLALARELKPDVILCDIGLPDMDGYDVVSTLRRDEAHRATRIVALSGYAQPEDRQRARDMGFDEHMAKPPDVDKLMTMLAR